MSEPGLGDGSEAKQSIGYHVGTGRRIGFGIEADPLLGEACDPSSEWRPIAFTSVDSGDSVLDAGREPATNDADAGRATAGRQAPDATRLSRPR
jgi:hypothetical protein